MCAYITVVILLCRAVMKPPFPFCINFPFQTCGHGLREYLLGNALVFADLAFLGFIRRAPQHNQSLCRRCPRHCLKKKNYPDQKLVLRSVWNHHHKATVGLLVTHKLCLLKPWCLGHMGKCSCWHKTSTHSLLCLFQIILGSLPKANLPADTWGVAVLTWMPAQGRRNSFPSSP